MKALTTLTNTYLPTVKETTFKEVVKKSNFKQASQTYRKIDLPPRIKSYCKLRHRDNVMGGRGVLPILRHVDTIFKGIEMIAIRNSSLKCAELGSDWLCSGFSKSAHTDPVKVSFELLDRKMKSARREPTMLLFSNLFRAVPDLMRGDLNFIRNQ